MARKPDDWMPLHIGKYLADTAHLTRDQHGAYLLLLMAYWTRGGALPDDDVRLASIAKATLAEWRKMRAVIVEFFVKVDGLLYQVRAEVELANAVRLTEAKSKAGQKGSQKRWQNDNTAIAQPSGGHKQSDTPLPLPKPEERSDDDGAAALSRDSVKAITVKIAAALDMRLGADPQQITWFNVITELLREGISEREIMAAADVTRRKGLKNINYLASVARNPKQITEASHGQPKRESVATSWTRVAAELAAEIEGGDFIGNSGGTLGAGPPLLEGGHEGRGEENRPAPNVRRLAG